MIAQRFAGKPLRQPHYSLRDVPRCAKDLSGSSIREVNERDDFIDAMAEMVLLCNEVMRRQGDSKQTTKRTSKPLSLEYIADRLDVDDPVFGFFVRTADANTCDAVQEEMKFKEEMLQGFIVATTFTNWQKTFRWDSMHHSAFSYDEEILAAQMASGERKYDRDGSLAAQMEATVRCGDPWNEGIVWPRIVEISLLGGLGCGKALLSLMIERLEGMPSTGKHNYDFVVLQATDNSIKFYESMGFVRVGGITVDKKVAKKQKETDSGSDAETESESESESKTIWNNRVLPNVTGLTESKSSVVSSAVLTYVTTKAKETPSDIAKKLMVDVWDVIFLNQFVYPDITPRSRLWKGTNLFYPDDKAAYDSISNALQNAAAANKSSATQWYFSKDNETPKFIATKFNCNCRDLVEANRQRISDLETHSRLIEGTKLQVSNFDVPSDEYVPYCHWTFPDDEFDGNEPSYMMARKLNRRVGKAAKMRPIQASFEAAGTKIVPLKTSSAPVVSKSTFVNNILTARNAATKGSKKRKRHPEEPIPPKKPMTGYFFFMSEMRRELKAETSKMVEISKIVALKWKELPSIDKAKYEELSDKAKKEYHDLVAKYQTEMEKFRKDHSEWVVKQGEFNGAISLMAKGTKNDEKPRHLYNKVVKLNCDGLKRAETEFVYYYVLTYLPDLRWCHLAPMRKVGNWGLNKPKAEGRPIWMLVNEDEGKEIDVTADVCEVARSRAMRGCPDADQEQWDIFESSPTAALPDKQQ